MRGDITCTAAYVKISKIWSLPVFDNRSHESHFLSYNASLERASNRKNSTIRWRKLKYN